MHCVALIPLRGGSKGIQNKNIKTLYGRPLCAWTLQAAHEVSTIDEVYVSTDSDQIADVVLALDLGVKVLKRPDELATDKASTDSVALHFADNVSFDRLVTIQATSPLLTAEHLRQALAKFESQELDSLLSTNRLKQFLWNEDGSPMNYDPLNRPRRQDFNGAIVENGAFYISKRSIIESTSCRIGGRVGFFDMPDETKIEIDDPMDFQIAEMMLAAREHG